MSSDVGRAGRLSPRLILRIAIACILLSSTLSQNSFGQQRYSGIVVDAETGAGLPAAGIRILNTYTGTITNIDGRFVIDVPSLPTTLVFRYVGYQTQELILAASSPTDLRIEMAPAVVSLGEVIVTGENPAIEIMRRVIERKKQMRSDLDSYTADAYNRFTISNDTGIVSIIESFSRAFWRKNEGIREVNLMQKKTENLPFNDILPAAMFVTNLYDDNIELSGFEFPGVTHPQALSHYRFSLVDYTYLDEALVYEINVEPRNSRKIGFKGSIRVLDQEYVLLEVNLSPGKAFLFPPPVEDFQIVMYQQFTDYGDGIWLPSDLHARTKIKVGMGRLLTFPEINVDQLSRLTNYQINAATPDSLFARDAEDVAVSDTTYSENYLASLSVPLTQREADAYQNIDSTLTLEKAFKPGGVFGRGSTVDFSFGEDGEGGSQTGPIDTDVTPHIIFNRVEGLRIGADLGFESTGLTGVRFKAGLAYMTAIKDISYKLGGGIFSGDDVRVGLDALYYKAIEPRYQSEPFSEVANTVLTLFGRKDYYDYFLNESLAFKSTLELRNYQSRIGLGYNIEQHRSYARQTSYDLVGRKELQPPNPSIREGDLRSITASVVLNDNGNVLSVTGSKSLRFDVEHSSPSIGESDFDFTVARATLDWRFNTFGRRRLIPQSLDVRLTGSTHRGTVPAQKLQIVDASNGIYTPFGSLRAGGVRPFEGDNTVAIFWEHNFRTSPFELIGAWSLARSGITLSVFGGHGRTEISNNALQGLTYSPRLIDGWYHEAGLSIGGLVGILRLDVAKRIDSSGFSVGVAAARLF